MTTWDRKYMCWLAGVVTMVLVAGCDQGTLGGGTWEYKEVSRIESPDAMVETVTVQGDGGATTSTVLSVHLVPKGARLNPEMQENSVFAADHTKNFKVVWVQPKLLGIHFEEARFHSFKNYWYDRAVQNFRHVVEVQLKHEGTNFALPEKDRNW